MFTPCQYSFPQDLLSKQLPSLWQRQSCSLMGWQPGVLEASSSIPQCSQEAASREVPRNKAMCSGACAEQTLSHQTCRFQLPTAEQQITTATASLKAWQLSLFFWGLIISLLPNKGAQLLSSSLKQGTCVSYPTATLTFIGLLSVPLTSLPQEKSFEGQDKYFCYQNKYK